MNQDYVYREKEESMGQQQQKGTAGPQSTRWSLTVRYLTSCAIVTGWAGKGKRRIQSSRQAFPLLNHTQTPRSPSPLPPHAYFLWRWRWSLFLVKLLCDTCVYCAGSDMKFVIRAGGCAASRIPSSLLSFLFLFSSSRTMARAAGLYRPL